MAEEKGKWVTIKGSPVFIKEGWTLSQAFANRKKFTKDGKPKGKTKISKKPSGYEKFLANENGLKIGKGQDQILAYDLNKEAVKYKENPTTKNKHSYSKRREDYLDYEKKKEGRIAKDFNGEYREEQYGDRFYKEDTIEKPLNKTLNDINKKYSDLGVDFRSRIVDGNIEIYDSTETIGSEVAEKLDKEVKKVFGENAYLEPIDSVSMNIAGVYVDKPNRWEDDWSKEHNKNANDMERIERAVNMYDMGDFGADELQDYFSDRNEMWEYLHDRQVNNIRDAFFSKDAYSKENMKRKEEILKKEKWGSPEDAFRKLSQDSSLRIFQPTISDPLAKQLKNFEERVNSGDGHNKDNLKDTITRLKNLNSSSLTAQFIDEGGEKAEGYARKKYGDAKVDTALWLENELMQRGYNKIYTQLEPNGMINDRNHTDMIIKGDMPEKNLSIAYNFNKDGEAVISLQGMSEPGVYGELVINDKNRIEIRDITSGSSIGGYPEFEEYYKPREGKLTIAEDKEYADKVNAYYRKHYSDGYNEYAEKVRKDIIKKRG